MNKMYYIAKVNQLQYTINAIRTVNQVLPSNQIQEAISLILIANSKRMEEIDNHADDESYFVWARKLLSH